MQALQSLIPLLITLSLAGLVLAIGLNSTPSDLLYVVRRPAKLFRAILAIIVIPPIAAGILISFLPLEPIVKAGIMMMAISPVPPLVPGKQLAMGGRKEYAYGLYVTMALLTLVTVPVVSAIAGNVFGRELTVSVTDLVETVAIGVIAPLVLGLMVHQLAPGFAGRIWRIVYKISLVLVVIAFLPILIKMWPAVTDMIGNGTVLAMAVVTSIGMFGGHLLGGPELHDRATLAIASAVRHPGIALSIAGTSFQDPRVSAAILLFLLVGLIVSVPYTAWIKHMKTPGQTALRPGTSR